MTALEPHTRAPIQAYIATRLQNKLDPHVTTVVLPHANMMLLLLG